MANPFRIQESSVGASGASTVVSPLWQGALWIAVAVGVFFSEWASTSGGPTEIPFSWTRFGFALFIGLVLFSTMYSSIKAAQDSPALVKLSLAAQSGAFWPLLMKTVSESL